MSIKLLSRKKKDMIMKSGIRAVLLLGALAAVGCGSTVDIEDSSASSAGAGSPSGSGGSGPTGTTSSGQVSGSGGQTGSGGEPATPMLGKPYQTDPGYFDAVLDSERNRVFLSYGGDGKVNVIDLSDGSVTHVKTGWKAEFMHFDPVLDQVIVSLPTKEHSSYWWDDEQEGYVAAIDATTLADPKPISIPMDPWQVVSDGTGHVYASGGSGQWTSLMAIDLATGATSVTSEGSVYEQTSLQIHPSLGRAYGADTGLSPSDIERYDLQGGKIVYGYDSKYHGDYPMCGDLRIHPSGNTIYTRCGHVFLASNTKATDMTWVGDLGIGWKDLAFHPSGDVAYVLQDDTSVLQEYDTVQLMHKVSHPLSAPAERVLAGRSYLVLVRNVLGGDPKTEIEVIQYSSL